MPRTADYTIQGFIYQFHKTLLEILNSANDEIINVEGLIEDVEIVSPSRITAIQCKYHEAKDNFTLSSVYKPLLQMMEHFHENPNNNISYRLYAYFPNVDTKNPPPIGKNELEEILKTSNEKFKKYVSKLKGNIDLDSFLKVFEMEFGLSLDDLETEVAKAFESNNVASDEIDTLIYPNAIDKIARLSCKHDASDRVVKKSSFLKELNSIRKTAVTRWTLALRTRRKVVHARRLQLKPNLDKNVRLRYFIIDSTRIEDYSSEIVMFISDYLDKFHFKQAHTQTPVFFLVTDSKDFNEIQSRLFKKGVVTTDGYVGGNFEETYLFRDPRPTGRGNNVKRDFILRMVRFEDHSEIISKHKCDDLFVVGGTDISTLDTVDTNLELLEMQTLSEIKYVLGLSNVIN